MPEVTPEILDKVRQKEKVNILAKIAAGKTITGRERKLSGLDEADEKSEAKASRAEMRLPIYTSMSQCASATGIPRATIKKAVTMGCPAVQQGRINLGVLLKWLFEHTAELRVISPRDRLAEAEALIAEQRLLDMRGAAAESAKELAKKIIVDILGPLKAKLNVLPLQLSVRCNPTDPNLARTELEAAFEEALKGTP